MSDLPTGNDPIGMQQMNHPQTWRDGSNGSNLFENYFGPPTGEIKTNPYDKFGYTNFDLPEAYEGRNLFLRDTIDGFIMEGVSWYTTMYLPYVRTDHDEHHFAWNEWHFDTHLVGRVPEEGVSRLIRSSKRSFKESTVWRGIAFQLEHGFMNTPDGRQQYVMDLKQIKQSVQETANHDVVAALLSCRRYDREWEKRHGVYHNRPLDDSTAVRWGNGPMTKNTPTVSTSSTKSSNSGLGAGTSRRTCGFPPKKLCLYLAMVSPEKTEFMRAGTPGRRAQSHGLVPWCERLRDAHVRRDEGDLPIDLLRRNQTIGEYNVMHDPLRNLGNDQYTGYRSSLRDIVIYNEDEDQWAHISLKKALKAVQRPDNEDPSRTSKTTCCTTKTPTARCNDVSISAK